MPTLGRACLILALAIAAWGIAASIHGARSGRRGWVSSGRHAVYAVAAVLTIAFGVLELAFLRTDLSNVLVANHSSTTTPTFYKFSGPWSSQEGSLLLWVWLLSLWSSGALYLTRRRLRDVAPWATAVLLGFATFFVSLLVFKTTPFAITNPAPPEGAGLSPLLRHPSMMMHPPMLYSGYTLFTVPFALAVGALIAGRLGADWIKQTRAFTLAAWACLGVGIVLGARWSYSELGWDGYWAWDPVENASLMPWLTGTAFLHSAMIQEKRGMLRTWNLGLVLASGILAVLGTFLVRSGVLESIHAFGASTLGVPFLVFIGVLVTMAVGLLVWRSRELRSENRLDSLFSRESIFLLNNLVLVGMCFVVFWGTFFPLISEALTGERAAVGPPWFDRYAAPLAIILVLLSGIGPVIAWRRATWANARRNFVVPVSAAGLCALTLVAVGGPAERPRAFPMFCAAAFVLGTVGQELFRGVRARRAMASESLPVALVSLVRRNQRRYGGYTVHVGIAVVFVGIAASTAFNSVRDVRLSPGDTARVKGYDLTYVRATSEVNSEKIAFGAVLDVRRDGDHVATLRPSQSYYPSLDGSLGALGRFFEGERTSEVGLRAGMNRDVWTAVEPNTAPLQKLIDEGDRRFAAAAGKLAPEQASALLGAAVRALAERYRRDPPPANFRLMVSPMASCIWLGVMIALAGALIAIWPRPPSARRELSGAYKARLARELSRA